MIYYDIVDDKRRRQVAKWLEINGAERIQYSVYLLTSVSITVPQVIQSINALIEEDDAVIVSAMCKPCIAKSSLSNFSARIDIQRQLTMAGYSVI